jgi:raffinose/stachyose/melibiose transport system substrate-binding protein
MRATGRLASLFLLVLLPLASASLGANSTAAQGGPVTVSWWLSGAWYDEDRRQLIQTEFVDPFNAAHPDIRLEVSYPENPDALRTAVQAGQGPDIIVTAGPAVALQFAEAGRLLPLDTYAAKYDWQDKLLPAFYQAGLAEGKLYSLPMQSEALGTIYYNKTVFDQHGWKPPTNRAEFEQLCQAAVDAGLLCFSDGSQDNVYENQYWVGGAFHSYAGADKVYEALTGKRRWDDPLFTESIRMLKEWMDKGWINDGPDGYFSVDYDTIFSLLAQGSGIMVNHGTWAFASVPPAFADTGQEWDWFLLPPLRDGVERGFDISVGATLSLNAASAHPDAAAEVLDFMFSDKSRILRIAKGMNFGDWMVPLRFTHADLAASGADDRFLRYFDEFGKDTVDGQIGYTIWTFWPPKTQQYISQEFDSVLTGDMTPEAFTAGLQKVFAEEVAGGWSMPIPPTTITSPD